MENEPRKFTDLTELMKRKKAAISLRFRLGWAILTIHAPEILDTTELHPDELEGWLFRALESLPDAR